MFNEIRKDAIESVFIKRKRPSNKFNYVLNTYTSSQLKLFFNMKIT